MLNPVERTTARIQYWGALTRKDSDNWLITDHLTPEIKKFRHMYNVHIYLDYSLDVYLSGLYIFSPPSIRPPFQYPTVAVMFRHMNPVFRIRIRIRSFWVTRIRIHKQNPVNLFYSPFNILSKILFRYNYFLNNFPLTLRITRCLNHLRKLHKNCVCIKLKWHIYVGSGSGKNGTRSATLHESINSLMRTLKQRN